MPCKHLHSIAFCTLTTFFVFAVMKLNFWELQSTNWKHTDVKLEITESMLSGSELVSSSPFASSFRLLFAVKFAKNVIVKCAEFVDLWTSWKGFFFLKKTSLRVYLGHITIFARDCAILSKSLWMLQLLLKIVRKGWDFFFQFEWLDFP